MKTESGLRVLVTRLCLVTKELRLCRERINEAEPCNESECRSCTIIHKIINDIIDLIIENGLSSKKDFIGCSIEEIRKIEKFYGIKLPGVYHSFLKKMGKSAGAFMVGTDMFYANLFELREWAIELLQESGTNYKLPNEMFVFSMHQGYEFCCFDVSNSQDPKIYQYIENEKEPSIAWDNFSGYLKEMVQKHLSSNINS